MKLNKKLQLKNTKCKGFFQENYEGFSYKSRNVFMRNLSFKFGEGMIMLY